MGCIFCKIINSRTEEFVYEDGKIVVLISKFQTTHGHLTVTFKNHYENLNEVSEEDYAHLQNIVKKYSDKLYKVFNPEKVYIILLAEEVKHIHFHLIPRYAGQTTGPRLLTENIQEVEDFQGIIAKLKEI